MKTVRVVAAVICDSVDCVQKVFATARGYGAYKGWWEFPGGKVEPGEKPEEALQREIREELSVSISVGAMLQTVEYDYPEFHLSMDCFLAQLLDGEPVLNEAEESRWLEADNLNAVDWLPADRLLLPVLSAIMNKEKEQN